MHIEGYEPVDHGDMAKNSTRALAYADALFLNASALGKTGGFKIRPHHILAAPASWAALLKKHDTRLVWNYRSNTFKASVGHYPIVFHGSKLAYEGIRVESRGNATGATQADESEEPPVRRLLIEDMEGLARIVRDRLKGEEVVERALQRLGHRGWHARECTLPVSYESMLRDAAGTIGRVQQFLGMDASELHAPLRRKATHDNLCELVENHQQVCNAFFGCSRLRWMLEDPGCTCTRLVTNKDFVSRKFCP